MTTAAVVDQPVQVAPTVARGLDMDEIRAELYAALAHIQSLPDHYAANGSPHTRQ